MGRAGRGGGWLVVACGLLADCARSPPAGDVDAAVDLAPADAAPACRSACPACGADELCVAPPLPPGAFAATCLRRCVDDRDCAAPDRCVDVDNAAGTSSSPAVCVSDADPAPCGVPGSAFCSELTAHAGITLCDGATLLVALAATANNLCAFERQPCPPGQTCHKIPNDGGAAVLPYYGRCE